MPQAKDKVSKADTRRINRAKLQKASAAAANKQDLNVAVDVAVDAMKRGERAALTFFYVLNAIYGPTFDRWWKLTAKDVLPDGPLHNLKGLFADIETVRKSTVELSLARGLSNEHKLWSDMKAEARREAGGETRDPKSTREKVRESLSSAYRALLGDDFITEDEAVLEAQAQIFKLALAFGAKAERLNR